MCRSRLFAPLECAQPRSLQGSHAEAIAYAPASTRTLRRLPTHRPQPGRPCPASNRHNPC
eukprot:115084-Chlamydomonas_euryale.AAC.1